MLNNLRETEAKALKKAGGKELKRDEEEEEEDDYDDEDEDEDDDEFSDDDDDDSEGEDEDLEGVSMDEEAKGDPTVMMSDHNEEEK